MGGTMDFKTALSLRLDAMKPSHATIQGFLAAHPHRVSKGRPHGRGGGIGLWACPDSLLLRLP